MRCATLSSRRTRPPTSCWPIPVSTGRPSTCCARAIRCSTPPTRTCRRLRTGGSKLILWHGWADLRISPLDMAACHGAVRAQLGQARAEAFERLCPLPGVHHCSGGEGPSLVDLLAPSIPCGMAACRKALVCAWCQAEGFRVHPCCHTTCCPYAVATFRLVSWVKRSKALSWSKFRTYVHAEPGISRDCRVQPTRQRTERAAAL